MAFSLSSKRFQQRLLAWFDRSGRKDLPWQHHKNPYRVWISEIMLQQTQVRTVIPYFERFISRFPTVTLLAKAPEDEVLHHWTGLGYYQRARNLHRAAKMIVDLHQGQLPDTLETLQELPGIGRSTAGAILSIAFQKKSPILDGNVKRVLTRLHGVTDFPGDKKVLEQLWVWAEELTPDKRVADYAQAIMDLGATLCVRGQPQCGLCPFELSCVAHALGIEKKIPVGKPRKTLPIRDVTLLVFQDDSHRVLLEKRPSKGIWAGLWSLPEIKGVPTLAEMRKEIKKRFQCKTTKIKKGESFRHNFSHFHLSIQPVFAVGEPVIEEDQYLWYNLKKSQRVGLPAPIKLLLSIL